MFAAQGGPHQCTKFCHQKPPGSQAVSYRSVSTWTLPSVPWVLHSHMSNGLNLLHPRKDVAEMVIVFCVSLIVPEDLMFAIKSGEHVYQESSFFVSPLSFLRVSWWYQVSMSWCNCSKMSEVLAGAYFTNLDFPAIFGQFLGGNLRNLPFHLGAQVMYRASVRSCCTA